MNTIETLVANGPVVTDGAWGTQPGKIAKIKKVTRYQDDKMMLAWGLLKRRASSQCVGK